MSYPVADNEMNEAVAVSGGTTFDIKKFIFKLLRFLPWIILSLLLSYFIVTIYLRYTPQVHKISAHVLIKDNEESSPDYNVLRELGVMPGSKEVQNQIDIIESYALISGIVDSLDLQLKLISVGRIGSTSLYGSKSPVYIHTVKTAGTKSSPASCNLILYDNRFSLSQNNKTNYYHYGDTFLLSGLKLYFLRNPLVKIDPKGYTFLIQDTASVASAMRSSVDVEKLHEMGGIVEISMLDEVPERAINIINKLVEAYNTAGVTDKNVVGNKTSNFLKERVDTVAKELDNLEIQAETFKRTNKISDITAAGNQYIAQSTVYDNQRVAQLGEIKLLESLQEYINNAGGFADIIPSDNGLKEQTLQTLITQYNSAVLNYQDQSKISTEKDPVVARLKNDITQLKTNILKNIESIRNGYQTNLNQVESQYDNFEGLLSSLPEKERELLKLKRQISVKEQLYLYLLQKKEETELSLVSNINNTRVVDSAFDQGIVLPKASQIKTLALLLGILIPVALMLLLDFFNNKITDKKEIEEGTSVPIAGELSYNKKMKKVIVNARSRSVVAEQFRLIRTNLQYIAGDAKSKTILVTSFMSGEGKSFVSINLAGSLSVGEAKVLLIEMDLRKPKLSDYLEIKNEYGLTDYIVKDIPFAQIIKKINALQNVDLITSGPIPPNPTELMMHPRMGKLLAYAKENYDYVVIDSSPVGLVADTFTIGRSVDLTLFILRHKYSYKTTLKYISDLYVQKKLNRLNIIVNGIKESRGLGYAYGYGYGYSYGYGYGYRSSADYYSGDDGKN